MFILPIAIAILVSITSSQEPPPPPDGPPPPPDGPFCDTSGLNGTYQEVIANASDAYLGVRREILAFGCANHPTYVIPPNPNQPRANTRPRNVPAYPCFSDREPFDLSCQGGAVGWTIGGGVAIYSIWAGPQPEGFCEPGNDAIVLEARTYDNCSGHADPFGFYHYHLSPACLLNQVNDIYTKCHSPQIGWAIDGFPVYGPHDLRGKEIYGCDHERADPDDCLDECGGHDQHEIDGFKYHYHIQGPIGDLVSSPLSPYPGTDRIPYSIGCLRGVPYDWAQLPGSTPNGAICAADGFTEDYEPTRLEGLPLYTGDTLEEYQKNGIKGCKARFPKDKDKKSKSKGKKKSKDKKKSKGKKKKQKDKGGKKGGSIYYAFQGPENEDKWGEWLNPSKHIDKTGYVMIGVFTVIVIAINVIIAVLCCCCIIKKKKGYSKHKVLDDDEGINQSEIEVLNE